MTSQQVIELIKRQNGQITSKIIKDLIEEHKPQKKKMLRLYEAYTGNVPILGRTFEDDKKVNAKLNNDFRGDIVDLFTGYLFGYPIKYRIDSKINSDAEILRQQGILDEFLKKNNIDDLDSLTGKYASICGQAARLCYIDRNGKEKVMNVKPWEVVFVYDSTLDELQYAMIYYDIDLIDYNGKAVKRTKVEWYDDKNVTYFLENEKGDYEIDLANPTNRHLFDHIPVICYPNDDAMQGDFEKVENLIDAYDRMLSDSQNEIEEFRIAYLAFYGVEPTQEVLDEAKRTGALGFPDKKSETYAEYLIKALDSVAQFYENHKKTLNENIYKFSKAVDLKDEQFSGSAMSGESRKWKLVGLENKAIIKERKFTKATRTMFTIIASAWKKKNIKITPEDIQLQFTRNLPVDLLYYADVSGKLKGQVDEVTRLSLLPFVKDVNQTLKKMEEENAAYQVNFDGVGDGNIQN